MSLNHALYSFAYAATAVIVGGLREAGFSPAQVFSGLLAIMLLLSALMLPRRSPSVPLPDTGRQGALLPGGLVWLTGLLVMLAFLTESVAEGWSALHLERTLGGGPAEGAFGPAILGLTMGVGRLAGHLIGHRWRDLHVMSLGSLLAVAGLLMVAAAPGLAPAYAGLALTGLGVSVVAPLALANLGRAVPPQHRLAAISRASVLGFGAFFLGPPLMGLISEAFGLRIGFSLVALSMLAACVLLLPALARSVARATAS